MDEIEIQVEAFLDVEYQVNLSNYLLDNSNEWEQVYKQFKQTFLMDRMNDHWSKIPVQQFTNERRAGLRERISKRKLYLIKQSNYNDRWINAFCSWPSNEDDLRDCFIFRLFNEKIKLFCIETICENCFGIGYLEESSHPCTTCMGRGFAYSETVQFVSWRTIFFEPANVVEARIYKLPASAIQKKAVSIQPINQSL